MKRLTWDTTAPRRISGERRGLTPRPEDAVSEQAELTRLTWDELRRGPRGQ